MKKIRVLHFELDSVRGGIESFLYNLYSQTDKEKFKFEFVTSSCTPALKNELLQMGAIIHYISSYKNIFKYISDIKKLLFTNYDIVHIHKNSAANIIPIILCKKYGIKNVIVHSHNTLPSKGKITSILHRINKFYLNRNISARFACSKEAGIWMFGNNKFDVLSNGILTKEFLFDKSIRLDMRRKLNISQDCFIVGNVGRFTEQKNHKLLLEIFEKILKKDNSAKLLLIGEGELEKNIHNLCIRKNMQKNVIFLGIRQDIPQLMMAMDAFVMPSLYEGLPISAIEAQASGLQLYLSDAISKDTELTDGVNWFSIKDNIDIIANNIISKKVISDFTRKERNKIVAQAGYDMHNTCNFLCNYYLNMLKKQKTD